MVRYHVAQRARAVIELASGLDPDRLGGGDLDVTHVVAVPKWLKDAVGKSQHQDVLDSFLAKEMIDPINLVFPQNSLDLRVEGARRGEVVPERLFDDHAAPTAVRLAGQLRATKMLNDGAEKLVGNGEVEQHVTVSLGGALLREPALQLAVNLGLREIALDKGHTVLEPIPGRLIDSSGPELSPAVSNERFHHLPKVVPPG